MSDVPINPIGAAHRLDRILGKHKDAEAQLPDRHGDVIDDIAVALATPGELSANSQKFYREVLARFDRLTVERDQARREASELRQALRSALSSPDEEPTRG